MIKNIIQHIKDVKHTMSFSSMEDFIWIYAPLVICTCTGFLVGVALVKAIF